MAAFLEKGEGQEIVSKVEGLYNFAITKKKGGPIAKSWIIDLKHGKGNVKVGETKDADASFVMQDDDFVAVSEGKL